MGKEDELTLEETGVKSECDKMEDNHVQVSDLARELESVQESKVKNEVALVNLPEGYVSLIPLVDQLWGRRKVKSAVEACEGLLAELSRIGSQSDQLLLKGNESTQNYSNEKDDSVFIVRYQKFANDAIKMGKEFKDDKDLTHALVSFYAAGRLHILANKGDLSIRGIAKCLYYMRRVVGSMSKSEAMKEVALNHVIPLMHEMLQNFRSIKTSNEESKSRLESYCLSYIAHCYGYCGENKLRAELNESAIALMKEIYKDKAGEHKIYGHCLNNAGVAYARMGDIKTALVKYEMSLAVKGQSEWSREWRKDAAINRTKKNVENNVKKLLNE